MDKKTFKIAFNRLLVTSVDGLTEEQKLKYMKKWIRDFENTEENNTSESITLPNSILVESSERIGELVRTKLDRIIRNNHLVQKRCKLCKMQDTVRIYLILIIRCLKRLHLIVP